MPCCGYWRIPPVNGCCPCRHAIRPRSTKSSITVGFSLEADGAALIDNEILVATRSYSYDATGVLGMSAEEQMLREALAEDLARRVLRLIEGVEPEPANIVASP